MTDQRVILQEVFPTFHLIFGAPIWVWIAWLIRKRRTISIENRNLISVKARRKLGGKGVALTADLGEGRKTTVRFWLATDEDGRFFSLPWVTGLLR